MSRTRQELAAIAGGAPAPDEVIILCVRWYLRFRLSYRDLASLAAELGVAVAPSTILRWVIRYTREFVRRWAPFEMIVGGSWRADETYPLGLNFGLVGVTKAGAGVTMSALQGKPH